MLQEIENIKQITIDQHYVPRFYMKNFSIIKNARKKEKVLIVFYQFSGALLKENIPIKSICYKDYFYGEDGKIEKEFAPKESQWAKMIQSIIEIDGYSLNQASERIVKQFAVFQYCRTLAMYNYGKDTMAEILTQHIHNRLSAIEKETVRELVDKKIEDEVSVADTISVCDELVKVIDDLDVCIIKYNTERKLITSDMPVIVMNPFCPYKAGFANVGVVILFPVSPELLVMIYDGKIYDIHNTYLITDNEQDVINLNKYQVISAEERILSREKEELVLILSEDELITKREEYRSKGKVNSSFDGGGTFFAAKSRSIHYDYELSFCKLPRALKKIPLECREAFDRQFNNEARINLLIRVYRLPDLIKKNEFINQVDISRLKDGYSKMQRFMDDYWNIATKERTITPELMRKLKTIPTSFFPVNKE